MTYRGYLALLGVLVPTNALAQGVIKINDLLGEVGTRFDDTWVAGRTVLVGQEWFRVNTWGSILHPGLLRFHLGFTPALTQSRARADLSDSDSDGRLIGYDFGFQLLKARAISADFRWFRRHRSQDLESIVETGLGTPQTTLTNFEFTNTNLTARVDFQNVLMPLRFEFLKASTESRSLAEEQEFLGNSAFETLRFTGVNRKTTVELERTVNTEPIESTNERALFSNRQQWGKGSSLGLSGTYQRRTGTTIGKTETRSGSGTLRLQHLRSVWSEWGVQALRSESNGSPAERQLGTATLAWMPFRNTVARGLARWERFDAAGLEEIRSRIEPSLTATVPLPLQGTLTAGGSLGYERYRLLRTDGGFVPVVNETRRVDEAGTFLLERPGVDLQSVVVTGPGGVVYVEGVDYELVETGGFVEVVALPGGRIVVGQSVTVDYRFQPLDELDVGSRVGSYTGSLRVKWLRVYYRRWFTEPQGLTDGDSLEIGRLRKISNETFGAELSWSGSTVNTVLRADRTLRRDGDFRVESSSASGRITVRPQRHVRLSAGAQYSKSEGSNLTVDRLTGHSSIEWIPTPFFTAGAVFNLWRTDQKPFDETPEIHKDVMGGNLYLTWQPGLLRFIARYYYQDWAEGPVDVTLRTRTTNRVVVELARRF